MQENSMDGYQADESGKGTKIVFRYSDPFKQMELEEYRREFEAIYGPTDLTLQYSSQLPHSQQTRLLKSDPKKYFDGLPPFAKSFLKAQMDNAASQGRLDNMPPSLIRLYVSSGMQLES